MWTANSIGHNSLTFLERLELASVESQSSGRVQGSLIVTSWRNAGATYIVRRFYVILSQYILWFTQIGSGSNGSKIIDHSMT